jgi:hypothetical protein
VRAAPCQSTRSAGGELPAEPVLTHLFVNRIIPSSFSFHSKIKEAGAKAPASVKIANRK